MWLIRSVDAHQSWRVLPARSREQAERTCVAIDAAPITFLAAGDRTTTSTWNRAPPVTPRPVRSRRTSVDPESTSRSTRESPGSSRNTRDTVLGNCDRACGVHAGGVGSARIGTLPGYYNAGLVSDGDPALAFGPAPDEEGDFSWGNGSRLYYANLTSNFPRFSTRSRGSKPSPCLGPTSWRHGRCERPDNVADQDATRRSSQSKQYSALFSDKEQIWADNASSSPVLRERLRLLRGVQGRVRARLHATAPLRAHLQRRRRHVDPEASHVRHEQHQRASTGSADPAVPSAPTATGSSTCSCTSSPSMRPRRRPARSR